MPVFIDTLEDLETTRRFEERYGSYPVIRIHDHAERDLAGRLDGNKVAGLIPVRDLLARLERGLAAFEKSR